MKVTFVGDIHGRFDGIDQAIKTENSDIIIQCGDFGIWPNEYKSVKITNKNVPVYFCRGNHEYHDLLDTYPQFNISNLKTSDRFVRPYLKEQRTLSSRKINNLLDINFKFGDNIYLCDNGSILNLNGKNILFIGGAESIDKSFRIMGKSWWPQELLRRDEIDHILDIEEPIDIIVSHTPHSFIIKKMYYGILLIKDPVAEFLEVAYEKFKPKLWFSGHLHNNTIINYEDTEFCVLDMFYSKDQPSVYTKTIEL